MKQVIALLTRARKRAGSLSELARRLDVSRANLQSMEAGRRLVPPDLVPFLAREAGEDVHAWTEYGVLASAEEKRRPRLEALLGKSLAGAGLAVVAASAKAGAVLIDCVLSELRRLDRGKGFLSTERGSFQV